MTAVDLERLRAPLLRYCAHLLRHHHDAEEVVQDVLLRLADGRGPAATEATAVWLFRCARNRCIDLRRKRRPQRAKSHQKRAFSSSLLAL